MGRRPARRFRAGADRLRPQRPARFAADRIAVTALAIAVAVLWIAAITVVWISAVHDAVVRHRADRYRRAARRDAERVQFALRRRLRAGRRQGPQATVLSRPAAEQQLS